MSNILIVEDEAIVALDLQQRLQSVGYVITDIVPSAEEALAQIAVLPPDLVLMDIMLAGDMDGIEAASLIRRRFQIPVVFLTAYSDEDSLQRAKQASPFGYLLKPCKTRELHSTIEIVLYRHQADEQVRKLSQVVEKSYNAIIIADREGKIEYVNPFFTRMTGYTSEEMLDRYLLEWVSSGETKESFAEPWKIISSGRAWNGESQHRRKSGESYWAEATIAPVRDEENQITHFVATAREITERKQRQQELVRLERLQALEELATGVSHNLNNLLTGVLLPAQALQMTLDDPAVLTEVDLIVEAAERARDVVKRLNESMTGRTHEQPRSVPVRQTVQEVLKLLHPSLDKAYAEGISIDLKVELPDLPPVKATPAGLQEVLLNLLHNALEAMPSGGVITVGANTTDDRISLHLTDTGVGMDEEVRRRAFEPFFTTKQTVDAGLGLATVYGLVTVWGGNLAIESQPGAGTTVTVELPVWRPEPAAEVPTEIGPTDDHARLLIIEDEELVRRTLSRMLSRDYQVDVVADGREALESFVPGRYDTAVVDLMIPDISGDEIAQEMKRRDPTLSTVLITGWDVESADRRLQTFDFLLKKPLQLTRIQQVVLEAIELHHARRKSLETTVDAVR